MEIGIDFISWYMVLSVYRQTLFSTILFSLFVTYLFVNESQKFVRIRKSVKNWSKLMIMKFETLVFGVMQVVVINCKLTKTD